MESLEDYRHALDTLWSSNYFKASIRVSINVSDDSDIPTLSDFIGNEDAVISYHSVQELKPRLRRVNLSTCGSKNYIFEDDEDDIRKDKSSWNFEDWM